MALKSDHNKRQITNITRKYIKSLHVKKVTLTRTAYFPPFMKKNTRHRVAKSKSPKKL